MEKKNVLFVDDEINVLNSIKRGLMGENYNCIFAESAKEALDLLEKHNIAVIVTDMRMPDMDGLALLKITKEKYPNTIRIVLSGYTQFPQVLVTINQGDIFKFITKPWKVEDEFKPVIREAIEYHELIIGKEEFRKILEKQNTSIQNILKKMDEKLTNNKNEYNNIRNFIAGLFEFMMIEIIKSEGTKADLDFRFGIVHRFCLGFMNTVPVENKNFKLYILLEEIANSISKLSNFKKVVINNIEDKNITCYGNFRLVYYIIMFILKYISNNNEVNQLRIDIALSLDDKNIYTEVTSSIKATNNKRESIKVSPSNITFLEKLINNTLNDFGMRILIQSIDDNIIVRYNVEFMVQVS